MNLDDLEIFDADFVPRSRAEILKSDAFKARFGEMVRDQLEDEQIAILAGYIGGAEPDHTAAGSYLAEILKPMIDDVVDWIGEDDRAAGDYVSL